MEKECPKCNESLKKGVAYRLLSGAFSVRFDKVDSFDKLSFFNSCYPTLFTNYSDG